MVRDPIKYLSAFQLLNLTHPLLPLTELNRRVQTPDRTLWFNYYAPHHQPSTARTATGAPHLRFRSFAQPLKLRCKRMKFTVAMNSTAKDCTAEDYMARGRHCCDGGPCVSAVIYSCCRRKSEMEMWKLPTGARLIEGEVWRRHRELGR